MSQDTQPMSAYAMQKRKAEQSATSEQRKVKRQHLSQRNIGSNQNIFAKKLRKQMSIKSSQINGKYTLANNTGKTRRNIVTKNLRSTNNKKRNTKRELNEQETRIKSPKKQPLTNVTSGKENDESIDDDRSFDPTEDSRNVFQWLIYPVALEDFLNNFEKRPVQVKRNTPSYYAGLVSTTLLDEILREKNVLFTKNIDITSYTNGVRETHNPTGRAVPSAVWDYYMNKCSVRMLNPQTFIHDIHVLNATLQEHFGCFVGANLYLTPPGSQGFAPHYDDIEAFVLQIEGKKRWRLYKPTNKNYLAMYSSRNFSESEIGEPIMDTVLEAGDMLYFPRGTIHQAETADDAHSLHITLSVYQKNTWYDFLEKLLPVALKRAAENNYNFRTGLPFDYLRYVGTAHTANNERDRQIFEKKVKIFLGCLIDYIDIDSAADLMAKSHIHDFLPPALTLEEEKCSVAQDGDIMIENGVVKQCMQIKSDTRIRLTRSHCIRLMKEDDGTYRIYYSTENSKEYHEYELQFLEIDEDFVPAVTEIIQCYPRFVRVKDLPIEYDENKIQIVKDLWEKGLLITDIHRREIATKRNKKSPINKKQSKR